jgi:3-oxoacyl-[acyl-carrier protein] reductase
MFGRLDGRIAIVTGSGQGIGRGIALRFAEAGATVLVATRREANGQETVDAIATAGGKASLLKVDLATREACEHTIQTAVERYGALHIVVHNAGIFPISNIVDLSEEELDHVLSVNLKAAFRLTKAALPHLVKSGWGRLLFTSSVTGPRVVMPGFSAYGASKAGLNGFIRTAGLEYAKRNITVNGVEPGFILTPAMDQFGSATEVDAMRAQIPAGKFGHADDVAYAMLFLASEEAGYITGQTIVVDGGSTLPENQKALELLS